MADFRRGALTVVGEGLHDDGHAVGAVAFVNHGLVVVGVVGAQSPLDGALNVVVGHIHCLGLGNDGGQTGVVVGVAGAAGLDRHDDLLGDLGECGAALGVCRAFGLLNIMPLGMSGHRYRSLPVLIDN